MSTEITVLIFSALLVESIVNIVKNIEEKQTSWKYWAALAISVGVSILVAYNWQLDLFELVGLTSGKLSFIGPILTGLIISRGANVVNDLVDLVNLPKG